MKDSLSTDEVLNKVALAKSGDTSAFGELYTEFYSPLFRFVLFRVKDQDTAEDIVSQTFLKWFESLARYEPKIKPLNYLYTISMRLVINESQKKKSDSLPEDAEEFIGDPDQKEVEDILNTRIDFEKVGKVIKENLNDAEKEIIYLKYIDELENQEISEMIGKTENNIRQIEWRALKKIRLKIKENI